MLDSRAAEEGYSVRRRRECGACGRRFTTYERVDEPPLVVVKKDGRREAFNRHKLLAGLVKACQKRPISMSVLESLVDEVERSLRSTAELEIHSHQIGEMVMERLRALDGVAYVRFASVYREFRDAREFVQEVERLTQGGAGEGT